MGSAFCVNRVAGVFVPFPLWSVGSVKSERLKSLSLFSLLEWLLHLKPHTCTLVAEVNITIIIISSVSKSQMFSRF